MQGLLRRAMAVALAVAATSVWSVALAPTRTFAAATAGSAVTVSPAGATSVPSDPNDVAGYAPDGTSNIAVGATVTSSSSYEMPSETWAMAFLNNQVAGTADGWSTNPYEKVQDPTATAWVRYDFGDTYDLDRVVVFPRSKSFPADFRVEVSDDGDTYTTVFSSSGNADDRTDPVVVDLAGVKGRYLRLYVTRRNGVATGDGYLVQLSELAVFGTISGVHLSIDKPALLLETGGSDQLPYRAAAPGGTPQVAWSSSAPAVATVDDTGKVTAVAPGEATITLTAPQLDVSTSIPVKVQDHVARMGEDNILISVFWPPTGANYVNDTQYRYLGDAGIDDVVGNDTLATKDINLKMAQLAYQHGLQATVYDSRFTSFPSMSDDQIKKLVREYTDVPGVGGFYLVDEPYDPTPYQHVVNAIADVAPGYDAHLNFLPSSVYPSEAAYAQVMQKYLTGIDGRGYLMFDRYPLGLAADSMDYTGFLTNLNTVRMVGLANNTKTATYLQSIGLPGGFRRPNATEIRYEANLAMAYGYKQLSYFTWFTPTNRSQTFTDAIVTADGQKTDLYEPVKQLDSEIHAIGSTLVKLDGRQVWQNGNTYGQPTVPKDFFTHAGSNQNLTLSYLRDRDTGRNYLMVVNNDFTRGQDISLTFDHGIGSVQELSRTDGTLRTPIALTDGTPLDRHLDAGEAVLYALPTGYDYEHPPAWKPTTVYNTGDRVSYQGKTYLAAWRSYDQTPGDPNGPWQETATTDDGTPKWTASRIFEASDKVSYQGKTYLAAWHSRNQTPGDPNGPWQEIAMTDDGTPIWTPSRIFHAGDKLSYQGHLYEALQYTRNQVPGEANSPWKNIDPRYTFDDSVQGWQAGQNVTGVEQVTSIANSPGRCFSGGCLQANTASVAPTAVRSVYLAPDQPIDMSRASTFSLKFNSWGSVPGVDQATGYQVTVKLTGANGATLTKTFNTSADAWTSLSFELKGWTGASAVSRIEIGTRTADTDYGAWPGEFQLDNVTWQ
ncbi:carbohydrate-binding protein [Actinopolymorpha singaporensis]